MKRAPHTTFYRGKRVYLQTRDGVLHIGKFIERLRASVVLDIGEFRISNIKKMGFWKAQQNTLKVPRSFQRGMADISEGRTVLMEKALTEPYPK